MSGDPPTSAVLVHRVELTRFTAANDGRIAMILLDHLVGELLHRHRNGQAKRLGGFEVEHEVELGRLQHW